MAGWQIEALAIETLQPARYDCRQKSERGITLLTLCGVDERCTMVPEYRNPLMITRTWHIKRTQAAKIARIGNDLGISHNALVRRMLDYALQAIDDGALVLRTRPSRYELIDDE